MPETKLYRRAVAMHGGYIEYEQRSFPEGQAPVIDGWELAPVQPADSPHPDIVRLRKGLEADLVERLNTLKALAEGATRGEWYVWEDEGDDYICSRTHGFVAQAERDCDAPFIAAASPDVILELILALTEAAARLTQGEDQGADLSSRAAAGPSGCAATSPHSQSEGGAS